MFLFFEFFLFFSPRYLLKLNFLNIFQKIWCIEYLFKEIFELIPICFSKILAPSVYAIVEGKRL